MEEKKIIYNIIMDIWELIKIYVIGKEQFNEQDWDELIKDSSKRYTKYMGHGDQYTKLYASLYFGVEKYIKGKEVKVNDR